jgi:hypothetical protein
VGCAREDGVWRVASNRAGCIDEIVGCFEYLANGGQVVTVVQGLKEPSDIALTEGHDARVQVEQYQRARKIPIVTSGPRDRPQGGSVASLWRDGCGRPWWAYRRHGCHAFPAGGQVKGRPWPVAQRRRRRP